MGLTIYHNGLYSNIKIRSFVKMMLSEAKAETVSETTVI